MGKKEPLYPHVPRSRRPFQVELPSKSSGKEIIRPKHELPELLEDRLLEASRNILSVISYFEVQRTDLLEADPDVRKFVENLKQMDMELARKRGWIAVYRKPTFLEEGG